MTYDESEGMLTTELTGRTIERVERHGKEVKLCTTCGHVITLQVDVNGDIMYKSTGVHIVLDPQVFGTQQGKF